MPKFPHLSKIMREFKPNTFREYRYGELTFWQKKQRNFIRLFLSSWKRSKEFNLTIAQIVYMVHLFSESIEEKYLNDFNASARRYVGEISLDMRLDLIKLSRAVNALHKTSIKTHKGKRVFAEIIRLLKIVKRDKNRSKRLKNLINNDKFVTDARRAAKNSSIKTRSRQNTFYTKEKRIKYPYNF